MKHEQHCRIESNKFAYSWKYARRWDDRATRTFQQQTTLHTVSLPYFPWTRMNIFPGNVWTEHCLQVSKQAESLLHIYDTCQLTSRRRCKIHHNNNSQHLPFITWWSSVLLKTHWVISTASKTQSQITQLRIIGKRIQRNLSRKESICTAAMIRDKEFGLLKNFQMISPGITSLKDFTNTLL